MKKIEEYVRAIKDFPKEGIIFRDVTSVMQDADGFKLAIDSLQEKIKAFLPIGQEYCPKMAIVHKCFLDNIQNNDHF